MDHLQLIETVKSSLLFSFRTGNVLIDTIVTGIIIMFATKLVRIFNYLVDLDYWSFMKPVLRRKRKSKILIVGRIYKDESAVHLDYSQNFYAVLNQLRKLDLATAGISKLSEIPLLNNVDMFSNQVDEESEGLRVGKSTGLMVCQRSTFKVTPNVDAVVQYRENDKKDRGFDEIVDIRIQLSSTMLNMSELKTQLDDWVEEFKNDVKKHTEDTLSFFKYIPFHRKENVPPQLDHMRLYSEFRFESTKSFNNIFFPEKDKIKDKLDFFSNNKDWYKAHGVPYTAGFLFHGEPGCGKTSTIKAIANYTKRHIVSVPLGEIKTMRELLNIFYGLKINQKEIPLDKRLYVLEDLDASSLKTVVSNRKREPSEESSEADLHDTYGRGDADSPVTSNMMYLLLKSQQNSNKGKSSDDTAVSSLCLSDILELLDGVMELDGRMVIVTTNYPERLDDALIRPGRIDYKVRFRPMTDVDIVKMYKHFYNTDSIPFTSGIPTGKWTPAEVTQLFLCNMNNPEKALQILCTSESLENIHLDLDKTS